MVFLYSIWNFFDQNDKFLFTDINDHAMLIVEIMMKRESEYFTHIAGYMPE